MKFCHTLAHSVMLLALATALRAMLEEAGVDWPRPAS